MILKNNGNSVVHSSDSQNIQPFYGNRGHWIQCCHWNLPQTDLVATVTKNWEF